MPGFLLEEDARTARKNVFDDWVDEQKKKAEAAAQAAQQAAQSAASNVATAAQPVVQPLSDEAVRRKQEFDAWVTSQQASQPAPQLAQPTPVQPAAMPTPTEIGPPTTPEAQQRASAFDQWVNQRQQDVAGVAQAVQGAIAPAPATTTAPSLPHGEEPATATDHLNDRWKTQFDFGATYTGNYRTGTPHRGIDLVPTGGGGIGAEVDAFAPGKVTLIQRDSGAGGLMVYVQDDQGLTHAYMHLAGTAPGLAVGQRVTRGQPIAQMGESGTEGSPHLHYEVRKNAASGDPLNQLIDPRPYLTGSQQVSAGSRQVSAPSDQPPIVQAIGKGQQAFTDTMAPLAKWFGDQTGIDPAVYLAIAANETGWGASQTAQQQNNLFSIQGSGVGGRWAGYDSPQAAFEAFNDLISSAPRYAKAWADRHNPLQFINDLRQAGYVVDEPGYPAQGWVDQVSRIWGDIRDRSTEVFGNVATGAQRTATDVAQRATTAFDNTIGQGAQAVASRAQDLADRSGDLVRSSAQAAQDAQSRVEATLARINAENEAADARQREARNRQLADVMQPRRYDFNQPADGGFRAPDLSGVGDALGGVGRAIGGANESIGRTVGPWFQEDPYIQQQRQLAQTQEGRRQQIAAAAGVTPQQVAEDRLGLGTGALIRSQQSQLEQEADVKTGDALAGAVIQRAKDAGWQPEAEQERIARTALSTLTPMNILLTVATGPEGLTARGLAEAAAFLGLSAVGAGAGEAIAPQLPESLRPYAALLGSVAAPVAGQVGLGMARGVARAPATRRFLRDESGELRIGRTEPPPPPEAERMYHGTGADFERATPEAVSGAHNLYGPGYYLTSDPRVAGGRIAAGGEDMPKLGLGPRSRFQRGEVIESGYAQNYMQPGGTTTETLDLGANVRPVDVPRDMNLFNIDRYTMPDELTAIHEAIGDPQRAAVFESRIARAFEGRPTGQQVYDALNTAYGNTATSKRMVNAVLRDAGFDGVTHQGGRINPMLDEAGRDIQHTVNVIFPESLDKIRNAISGRQGGEASLPFALRAGTGAAAAGVGYATAPEGATPEERAGRAALFGAAGLGAPIPLRGLQRPRLGGVGEFLRGERGEQVLIPPEVEAGPRAAAARLLELAAKEEKAIENPFSGPIADRLEQVGQQPVTAAEVADAGRTLAQLRSVGDRISGVPQQFATPEGLAQLRARLRVLAEEGASQKDWYSDSSQAIKEVTQGNLKDAEILAQLVAIYSPNTPVDTNMNNALQAWFQHQAGQEIKVAMGAQDKRASDLLKHGIQWEGRKTNNFYRNLMQHIDTDVYASLGKEVGQSGVTADIWMMRAFDYLAGPNREGRRWLKAPSEAQYNFIQDEVAALGKRIGWTPEQVQAAVWSSTKAAAEGTGIVEAGFHYGSALERRMAQVSYTASPGSSEMQRIPGFVDAPEHERAAFNLASESGFLDPVTKRDQLAEAMGVHRGRTIEAPEVYGEYVGPGLQAEVPVPAAKASRTEKVIDPATGEQLRDVEGKPVTKSVPIREAFGAVFAPARDALNAFAAGKAVILKQDAVPWTRVFWQAAPLRDANVNLLHIGRPLTSAEARQLNDALIRHLDGDGRHAVVANADGAWILNLQGTFERDPNAPPTVVQFERKVPFTGEQIPGKRERKWQNEPATREENVVGTWRPSVDEAGQPLPFSRNEDFNKQVREALAEVDLAGDPDANLSPFRGDTEYVWNDWSENPNGEGYRSLIESAGRTAAFTDVEAAITRRVRQAQADVARRYGWPPDPLNPFSGAEPGAAVGERGLPGPTAAEPAAGVGARAPPEGAGFTAPELPTTAGADIRGRLRDLASTRQEAAADPRLMLRLGGGALGGVAGAMTTPEDADPFARYAHIGGGVLAGAFGPRFIYSAITHPRPTAAELEALRPRAPIAGPAAGKTLAEHAVEYGKGNLLSGVTTSLSNIIGQAIELGRQPIVRTAAGYEDEAAAGVRAAAGMVPTALTRFGNAMRTGTSIYATKPGSTAHPFLRLITATDDFFRTLGEGMGRGMEARRVLTEKGNPTSAAQIRQTIQGEASRIAAGGDKAANLSVFGEGANTGLGKWISDQKQRLLGSSSNKDKALGMAFDALVPFSSVPDRLWTAGVMRSPGVNEVGQFAKAGYHIAHGDERAARTALAEMAVGSVVNAAILTQVANGNVTGPDDPEHPNSIRIGGTWVDYSGWGPYALPIALPAAIVESVQKTGNVPDAGTMEYASAMSKAAGKALMNQSYLSSFLRMAGALGRGDIPGAVGQLGGGYIDRYVPASGLLNQVEQSFDKNLRDVDPARPWEREASRIPFLADFLPKKVSPTTGEPAVRPRGSPLGTLLRAETEETDPLKHELARLDKLNYSVPELKDYPDTVSWHGTEIKLRPEEQRAVTAALGKARADLATEIRSPGWNANTDDEKAVFLKKQLARIETLKTQAWLDKVDPVDAETRLNAAERVAGRLVRGGAR